MPIARDKPGQLDRGPERDRRLAAQGGEGAIANVVIECPEIQGTQFNIGDRHLRRRRAIHPSRDRRVEAHRDPPAPFALEGVILASLDRLTVLGRHLPGSVAVVLVGVPVKHVVAYQPAVPLGRLIASLARCYAG